MFTLGKYWDSASSLMKGHHLIAWTHLSRDYFALIRPTPLKAEHKVAKEREGVQCFVNCKEPYKEGVVFGPKHGILGKSVTKRPRWSQVSVGKLWVTRNDCLNNICKHETWRPNIPVHLSCRKIRGSQLIENVLGTVGLWTGEPLGQLAYDCLAFRDCHGSCNEKSWNPPTRLV